MRLRKDVVIALIIDLVLVGIAWGTAFWLRFNFDVPDSFQALAWSSSIAAMVSFAVGLTVARVYRQVWRYVGLPELRQLGWGVVLGGLISAAVILMARYPGFPRSVLLLHPLLALLLLGAVRATWRTLTEQKFPSDGKKPLLILGSLSDAASAVRAMNTSSQWHCVGIVSPVPAEQGAYLHQIPVLGNFDAINKIAESEGVRTALIASPPGSDERRTVLMNTRRASLSLLTLPRPDEWLRSDHSSPRKIELEDLLGRQAVELDLRGMSALFSGKTVLVSGAGGSIGSELCRQIARLGVAQLVCVDASEIAIYKLEQELRDLHPQMRGTYYTSNVRELERLQAISMAHLPAVVFHAAAYKHVPLMESCNEIEAVRTNIMGTLHMALAAAKCGAQKFVLISTDKAVNPTNVMGATKRVAELVVQGIALQHRETEFVSVRFGNVLGSSGSVVPLFTEQISKGGPITVTHPDIVRYFMTIPEAARLVIQAGLMGVSGQIYVLDMGEPVKIADLAKMMIRLSGKSEDEITIFFTGLRPGEKLFEELLADDETTEPTSHPKLRVAKSSGAQALAVPDVFEWIESAGPSPSGEAIRSWLKVMVPEYKSQA